MFSFRCSNVARKFYICKYFLHLFSKIGFLTEQANFLVFFLRKITILWGWVFLAMARCQ